MRNQTSSVVSIVISLKSELKPTSLSEDSSLEMLCPSTTGLVASTFIYGTIFQSYIMDCDETQSGVVVHHCNLNISDAKARPQGDGNIAPGNRLDHDRPMDLR